MKYSFILGAPKSGTTSVVRSLSSYKSDLPDRKEIMYFDVNHSKGLKWYKQHANGDILLDGTPTYFSNKTALTRVLNFSKSNDCSFVIILRNPIDRYWSHVNDLISWGDLSQCDIKNDPFIKKYIPRGRGILEMSPYMYSLYANSLRLMNISGVKYLLIDFDEIRKPETLNAISNELFNLTDVNSNHLENHHPAFEWRSRKIAKVLNNEILRDIYKTIPNKKLQSAAKALYQMTQQLNRTKKLDKYYDSEVNDTVFEFLSIENANLYSEIVKNENRIGDFRWAIF